MLLAVDVGNSNIAVGVFRFTDARTPEIVCHFKLGAHNYAPDELCAAIDGFLRRYGAPAVNAAVVSSVVPHLTAPVCAAAKTLCGKAPLVVTGGIRTGFGIRVKNPEQLGTDIVSNAAAALTLAKAPLVILDMGTATTVTVVDENNAILGIIIIPGLQTSMHALCASAAQLGDIPLDGKPELIGRDTRTSISSGVLNGSALMLDGFVRNIREALDTKARGTSLSLLATGGSFPAVEPLLRNKFAYSDTLTLLGEAVLYAQNCKIV